MARRNEAASRTLSDTASKKAPSCFVRGAMLLLALALSACAQERLAASTVTGPADASSPGVSVHDTNPQGFVPEPMDSRSSHCASDELVLIACRIVETEDIASICVSAGELGEETRVYYAFGPRSRPVNVFPDDRSAHAGRFRKAVFRRPTGIGSGYAYTFQQGADKYVFYSVNSEDDSDFGVLKLPAVGTGRSRMVCDQESASELTDDALHRFTQTWERDAEIDGHGLPVVEE